MIGGRSRRSKSPMHRQVSRLLAVLGTIACVGASRPVAHPHTSEVPRASIAAANVMVHADACGGWRPKRPMLCAATVVATAVAGGLMSAIPNGGLVAFVAMAPLLLETCA